MLYVLSVGRDFYSMLCIHAVRRENYVTSSKKLVSRGQKNMVSLGVPLKAERRLGIVCETAPAKPGHISAALQKTPAGHGGTWANHSA